MELATIMFDTLHLETLRTVLSASMEASFAQWNAATGRAESATVAREIAAHVIDEGRHHRAYLETKAVLSKVEIALMQLGVDLDA